MKPQDSVQLDPEQLLKLLDVQLMAVRQRRAAKETSRTGFRVFSIVAIIALLIGSLWVAMYLLEDMRANKDREATPPGFVEEVR
jgi:uncharacterized iron-regulated membrane protein